MKKNILFGILFATVAAGCTERDAAQEEGASRQITFVPTVKTSDWNATRSALGDGQLQMPWHDTPIAMKQAQPTSEEQFFLHKTVQAGFPSDKQSETRGTLYTATTFDENDVFGVSGYRYDGITLSPATATANFLYNVMVSCSHEKWRANHEYYWPYNGDLLDFYAYWPCNNANVVVKPKATTGPMQIAYTVNTTDYTAQADLMTASQKGCTFSRTTDVELVFTHQLTAVKLVLAPNIAPGYIESIKFSDIATQGTLTVDNGWSDYNKTDMTIDMTAYNANGYPTTDNSGFIRSDGGDLTQLTSTLLMIPQTFTDDTQQMTVVFVNADHPSGIELTAQLTGSWEANTTVTYQLSTSDINVLNISSINFPSTETWGNAYIRSSYVSGNTVGLYAINATTGDVVYNNTKLTYDGTTWNTDANVTQLYQPGLRWFMYSPYKTEGLAHNGIKNTAVVTTAQEFFESGISAWTPNAKQDTEADLVAQDLQVGTGVETAASTMYFDMAHTMGLVHLYIPASTNVPNLVYYDGNEGVNSTTVVSSSEEVTTVAPSRTFPSNKPYLGGNNLFFFIARPGEVTLSATTNSHYTSWDLTNNTASITTEVTANSYVTHNVTNKYITRGYIKRGWVYEYVEAGKEWSAPAAGIYTFECWGAQGDNTAGSMSTATARGAYVKGNISLETTDVFYVYVGQMGQAYTGGWNGGGNGRLYQQGGGAGGGATDIRITYNSDPLNVPSLKSRIMVAGAGGGCSGSAPGAGGGLEGLDGHDTPEGDGYKYNDAYSATGGKQDAPGYPGNAYGDMGDGMTQNSDNWNSTRNSNKGGFGYGGNAAYDYCGGGGGGAGYYGGGASIRGHGGSGGGSSFIAGHSGCKAVTSMTGNNVSHRDDAVHPSGKNFISDTTEMVAGNTSQLQPDGTYTSGHYGNGYARITETFVE